MTTLIERPARHRYPEGHGPTFEGVGAARYLASELRSAVRLLDMLTYADDYQPRHAVREWYHFTVEDIRQGWTGVSVLAADLPVAPSRERERGGTSSPDDGAATPRLSAAESSYVSASGGGVASVIRDGADATPTTRPDWLARAMREATVVMAETLRGPTTRKQR